MFDAKILVPKLQKILDEAVASGEECGCQLAVFQHGELLADLHAGFRSKERRDEVNSSTLFPVFSVGKGLMATAFHRLVEKGVIGYDDPVSRYWPEFGCNGKEDTRVWHVMTHREALFEIPATRSDDGLADWELMTSRIAAARPAWTPGTRCCYHGVTYAWILGELARRADGRSFDRILREEVIEPAGMTHFRFGVAGEDDANFAWIDDSAFPDEIIWHVQMMHNPAIRRGFIPSFNGCGTALDLAKHYDALLANRLLRQETLDNALQLRRAEDDPVNPRDWAKFGLGYALCGPEGDYGRMFGHGGAAGSEGFADRATGLAVGFTKNRHLPSHPDHPIRNRISLALGLPARVW